MGTMGIALGSSVTPSTARTSALTRKGSQQQLPVHGTHGRSPKSVQVTSSPKGLKTRETQLPTRAIAVDPNEVLAGASDSLLAPWLDDVQESSASRKPGDSEKDQQIASKPPAVASTSKTAKATQKSQVVTREAWWTKDTQDPEPLAGPSSSLLASWSD